MEGDDATRVEEAKLKFEESKKFQNLFKGIKVFIGREVPRENLVFMIRSFGGEVSWDETVGAGSTFDIDDHTITHQVFV